MIKNIKPGINSLFSTPVTVLDLPNDPAINEDVDRLMGQETMEVFGNKRESANNNGKDNNVDNLLKYVVSSCERVIETIYKTDFDSAVKVFNKFKDKAYNQSNKPIESKCRLKVNNYWVNHYSKGDHHVSHIHPNSIFSAVVFLKIPVDCTAQLVLVDPRGPVNYFSSDISFSEDGVSYTVKAKESRMVIFPSWLSHYVSPESSSGTRSTLSINIGTEVIA